MLSKRETSRFCGQLKTMLMAGIPLLEALLIIQEHPSQGKRKRKIAPVINRIIDGWSFNEAVNGFLPKMAATSLQAAEHSGNLEEALAGLAQYYEERSELEQKLLSAMIYPALVLLLCLGSLLIMFIFVLPGIKDLLADAGGDLPLLTRAMLAAAGYISRGWPVFLLGIFTMGYLLFRRKNGNGFETIIFKIPILRIIYRQELLIQGFSALGSLIEGGTPILEALKLTADSSRSNKFRIIINKTLAGVENGEKLSSQLEQHRFFPNETIRMLRVGENTGKLGEMLKSIAAYQAKEREVMLKRVTAIIEPVMTLVVGLVAGLVVLAMFLPMTEMISKLQ